MVAARLSRAKSSLAPSSAGNVVERVALRDKLRRTSFLIATKSVCTTHA